jgi:hypothetical protein
MSRSATDGDHRKVTATGKELDSEGELSAGLTFDEHPRQSAWRSPRPIRSRLEARQTAGRAALEIHFVRGRALQCCVRAMSVVPVEKQFHFPTKGTPKQRNDSEQLQSITLQGADGRRGW